MDYQSLKAEFDARGFVVARQFLPREDFQELERQLERYVREVVPSLPESAAFYHDRARPETLKQLNHMSGDEFFDRYRQQPRWKALAEALVGEPAEAQQPEWFNKPSGTEHPTPPHQDNFYFCLRPPNVATLWLALDHIDQQNGCLRYVPGSHLRGLRPHAATSVLGFSQGITDFGPSDIEQEVALRLEPGDLLVHHGQTIHRADPNRSSTRQRRAFAMVFRGASCQRDPDAFARYEQAVRAQHEAMGLRTG